LSSKCRLAIVKGANRNPTKLANLRRIMAYLRATAVVLALLLFFCLAPLQWVALRRRWPLRLWLPVAFGRTLAALLRLDVFAGCVPPPREPRLIAANHVSWLDILVLCSVEPVCFLAKREVGTWPVASTFARLQETVFVDRERRRTIPGTNAAMAQRMLGGRPMLLFPEATTGDGLALREFHSSHFAAARDLLATASEVETVFVQPVAIRHSTPAAAWFGDATLLPHLWSILKGEPIRCALAFGKLLAYGRGENRKVIAGQAASAIASMLASMARAAEPDLAERAGTPALDPPLR
jgi:lyso-ornithine lipid O-acyltransferase